MLFDRDVDGVLSFSECGTALHTLGYRLSGLILDNMHYVDNCYAYLERELIRRISVVTEDCTYLSIEFNEFLKMMSRAANDDLKIDKLIDAFQYD